MQDCLTELRALSDVVKATGGPEGLGADGESFFVEEMLQNQYGCLRSGT